MGKAAGRYRRGRATGAIGRIVAVTTLVTGTLLTFTAPTAGAQDGSYFRLDMVPMLESELDDGRCDYGTTRTRSRLDAAVGDVVVFCYFVYNDTMPDGAGADAPNSQLIDDNGTPDDTTDDVVIDMETIEAGNTPIAQRSITLTSNSASQWNITTRAESSNSLNGDDGSNVDRVTVNVAGVVAPTTTPTTAVPTTTLASTTTSTSTVSTTMPASITSVVTVGGAVVNNQERLAFTGVEDELTSIWAAASIAAGLALLVGTRRRSSGSCRFFEAD